MNDMKISELEGLLNKRRVSTPTALLSQVRLTNDGLTIPNVDEPIVLDTEGLSLLGQHLKFPARYMENLPFELRASNINYHLGRNIDAESTFQIIDGHLTGVYDSAARVIPLDQLVETIVPVFKPDDIVHQFCLDTKKLHLDITMDSAQVTVPGVEGAVDRPMVGDITKAGIRLRSSSNFEEQRPVLETYLHRLVCSNGLAIPEPEFKIQLRGNTVDEILESLEENAREVMDGLPKRLEQYRQSAEVEVPGNLSQFMYQVGRERGLGSRIMDRVMEHAAVLPANPTVYDALNVFTYLATQDVSYANQLRLQGLGGDLASDTERMLHRCNSCERPI